MTAPTPPDAPPDPLATLTDEQLRRYAAAYGGGAPAGAPADGFDIRTEGVAGAARRLEEVIVDLDAAMLRLQNAYVDPPGGDHVSARIASNATLMFDNACGYVRVLRERTVAARQALIAQSAAYERADDPRGMRA